MTVFLAARLLDALVGLEDGPASEVIRPFSLLFFCDFVVLLGCGCGVVGVKPPRSGSTMSERGKINEERVPSPESDRDIEGATVTGLA